eukprot:3160993-Rhodomonas_salina.2
MHIAVLGPLLAAALAHNAAGCEAERARKKQVLMSAAEAKLVIEAAYAGKHLPNLQAHTSCPPSFHFPAYASRRRTPFRRAANISL